MFKDYAADVLNCSLNYLQLHSKKSFYMHYDYLKFTDNDMNSYVSQYCLM